jgi:exopolysaccharide biosynthesis polyprenyl glycosylphosphotransferase
LALFITVYIRYSYISTEHANFTTAQFFRLHIDAFTPLIFAWVVIFYIHNLYEITSAKNTLEFYSGLVRSLVVNFFLAVLFFYFANFTNIAPKTNLFIYLAVFSVFFILWRSQINGILKKRLLTKTIILSGDSAGEKLASKLNQNPQIGYRVESVIGDSQNFSEVSELIKSGGIKAIIADDRFLSGDSFAFSLNDFLGDLEIINIDKFNERVWRKINLKNVSQLWFLSNFATGRKSVYGFVKRFADFSISILLLPFVFLLGVFISLLIKICDMGPIFYKQVRIGYKGKPFMLFKFRTMRTDAESKGAQWTVENDKRVTGVGKFLRKVRLDELPQLINILKGEMSFVGPRAERPEFHQLLVKEIPFYDRRYLVKPGLTGWAQINYTYGSSVEDTKEKLSYDFYYLKNRSFIFDIGIILKTINIVLAGLGR